MSDSPQACDFCRGSEAEVQRLARGPAATICDECLAICRDILAEREESDPPTNPELACGFCGKDRKALVIAGPKVHICAECVARLAEED